MLDLNPIDESIDSKATTTEVSALPNDERANASTTKGSIAYTACNVADWASLRSAFHNIGHVDIAVANAGVSQECDYFADTFDDEGQLEEPGYNVLTVNYRAVLNFSKLALSAFRRQGPGGSLILVSSATAYSPEQSLPVYSATKLAVSSLSAEVSRLFICTVCRVLIVSFSGTADWLDSGFAVHHSSLRGNH